MITPELAMQALFAHCRAENWAGHDPYDALNSPLLDPDRGSAPKLVRLAATQLLKRSPLDIRALLRVPKTQNAKALALNIQTIYWLEQSNLVDSQGLVDYFVGRISELRSPGQKHWCWGYSFPWQTRTVCVPRHAPNLVCTTFVADALLSVYERTHQPDVLAMIVSAARYICDDLYFEGTDVASFSYPSPGLSSTVHNANLMAAALLLRVNAIAPDVHCAERALKAARFSAARQRADGSWPYGEGAKQEWIDNFHTGYNLSALRTIGEVTNSEEFAAHVRRGFVFYRSHFVREDGAARYFHDTTYPIDAHAVAQTILTLLEFADLDPDAPKAAQRVYDWAAQNMWDERGFFHYRVLRLGSIRTSYMRWSQAWMLLALAVLVAHRRRT
jgi:hypothetical protein